MRNILIGFGATLLLAGPSFAQAVQTPQPPLTQVPPITQRRDDLGPRTLNGAIVACTNLPTLLPAPTPTFWILAPHAGDNHEASNRSHIVVLNGGTPEGLMPGQRYFTRRWQPPANNDPISATSPASIRTSGWLTVIAADEHSALARVEYACDTVQAGDYLEPFVEPPLPTPGADGPTDFSNLGKVLLSTDRREQFGAGDVLNVDRGTAQLAAGNRIAFYRDRRNGTPLVPIGTGIVVEVGASTAKVVVDRASEEIVIGDYFGVRRQP